MFPLNFLLECSRIRIPIVQSLLNILLLAREEVPAHTKAYHAIVILDGVPLLSRKHWVIDGLKLVLGIAEEPVTLGGDAPSAQLIISCEYAATLIPTIIRSLRSLCRNVTHILCTKLTFLKANLILQWDTPLIVLANDSTARGISFERAIQTDIKNLALERLDIDGVTHAIPPLIIGVLIGLHKILLILDVAPLVIDAHRTVGIDSEESQLPLYP